MALKKTKRNGDSGILKIASINRCIYFLRRKGAARRNELDTLIIMLIQV
jgi:hypothetical protein